MTTSYSRSEAGCLNFLSIPSLLHFIHKEGRLGEYEYVTKILPLKLPVAFYYLVLIYDGIYTDKKKRKKEKIILANTAGFRLRINY